MATVESRSCQCFDSDAGRAVQLFLRRPKRRPGWARRLGRVLIAGLAAQAISLPPATASLQDSSPAPLGTGAPPQSREAPGSLHGAPPADPQAQRISESMAQRRNADRQKMLEADTEKLLLLAQQLKVEVDKSNKDMLSIDVVRRAEQIEKLARSVKEKMRGN